jgi:hypothetical protein
VPVHAIVRPAARMQSLPKGLAMTADAGQFAVTLNGQALLGTNLPQEYLSLVKPFELQHESPRIAKLDPSRSGADIRYVGVTSDYANNPSLASGGARIAFGIAGYGNVNTPSTSDVTFRVMVDRNRDGEVDFGVFSNARPNNGSGSAANVSNVYTTSFNNFTVSPNTTSSFPTLYANGLSPAAVTTNLLNNDVITILMPAANLGLTDTKFDYYVQAFYRGELIEETPVMTYDLANPGISVSTTRSEPLWLVDEPGSTVTLNYNKANFRANGSKGVLMLRPLNAPGNRAEKISVK